MLVILLSAVWCPNGSQHIQRDVMWFPMTLPTVTSYDVWYAAVIRLIISNKDSRWRGKKCPQLCQFIQMWQPWSDYDVLRQAYRALKEPFFCKSFPFYLTIYMYSALLVHVRSCLKSLLLLCSWSSTVLVLEAFCDWSVKILIIFCYQIPNANYFTRYIIETGWVDYFKCELYLFDRSQAQIEPTFIGTCPFGAVMTPHVIMFHSRFIT